MNPSVTAPTVAQQSWTCRATSSTSSHRGARPLATGLAGGLLLSALLGACVPDLDSLKGSGITSGAGGSISDCDGGCGSSAGNGGTGSASAGSGGTGGAGGLGEPPPPAQLRHDFEQDAPAGLHGWSAVLQMRPPDVLDAVELTTEAAHGGSGSLRMAFDGEFSGPDAGPVDPWWGVGHAGAGMPAGVELSMWMMSTGAGVRAEVWAQTGTSFQWNALGSVLLDTGQWQQASVLTPFAGAGAIAGWGIKIYAPLDFEGDIYLDDVSW